MNLDPTKAMDWEIAEAAEKNMKPLARLAEETGLRMEELIPMGRGVAKVDFTRAMQRLQNKPQGKYIDVTAITPTPLGEGKTTTVMGLIQGLGKIGKKVIGAIRQPSGGPTFNLKGSAAGGGLAQVIPLTPLSIGLTGDIDAVTNAHNLAMVALTSRMQHEANYDDAVMKTRGLGARLDVDPKRVKLKWCMDFCAQTLRNITIGKGGKMDGFEMGSGFQLTAASEVMTILAVAKDLKDMRQRMAKIVVAYSKQGKPVTTADLKVDGAMTAWLTNAINPNLMQTIEGQPVFVHAGPFANIALGQSSIIADELGVRLSDYLVTESGFGADIGFEKFWNLKCRASALRPNAIVLVATIRALKMHGGGPAVKPGLPLHDVYKKENLSLVEKGCENLIAHIEVIRKSGVQPVVCINGFHTDTREEIRIVKRIVEAHGTVCAFSDHWQKGGEGAIELAEAVINACNDDNEFRFLYELDIPLDKRIELIAREVYGASGVSYTDIAKEKLTRYAAEPDTNSFGICMVKTQYSLSHEPGWLGRPTDWELPIRDILSYRGAGLLVPVAGPIKLMPGTVSKPAFQGIDVDVSTGQVQGLF